VLLSSLIDYGIADARGYETRLSYILRKHGLEDQLEISYKETNSMLTACELRLNLPAAKAMKQHNIARNHRYDSNIKLANLHL
jgi:hypothetical protein